MKPPQYVIVMRAVEAYAVTRATLILRPSRRNSERVDAARGAVERALDLLIEQAVAATRAATVETVETVETGQTETTTAPCRNGHDGLRYALDDSPAPCCACGAKVTSDC